jgi:hypothetical protein
MTSPDALIAARRAQAQQTHARALAVQAAGADPVVRTTQWDRRAGLAVVPGRTVAVLVLAQSR